MSEILEVFTNKVVETGAYMCTSGSQDWTKVVRDWERESLRLTWNVLEY